MRKFSILKNVPQWEAEQPNLLEHERRLLAQKIGEALYDEGYIKIEQNESFVPTLNCKKSIVIKMTFEFE